MPGSERHIQQDNKRKPLPYTWKCIVIGFWGGLLCGFAGELAYLLHFVSFGSAFILAPLPLGDWDTGMAGPIIGIFIMALLSILIALFYKLVLEKWYSMWVGVLYGALIWFVVLVLLNPIFPSLKPVSDFGANTLVTTLCLFMLYGLFVGYSISFEYHELNQPKEAARTGNEDENES